MFPLIQFNHLPVAEGAKMEQLIKLVAICTVLIYFSKPILGANDEGLPVNMTDTRSCYHCRGINCYRTTLKKTEKCLDSLDICVTIFKESGVEAQGCLLSMPIELKEKCHNPNNKECAKCGGNLCNNLGREDIKCIECDSSKDPDCADDTKNIKATRCPISTSPKTYCYIDTRLKKTVRGCSITAKHQISCFDSKECILCLPEDRERCNGFDVIKSGTERIVLSFGVIFAVISHLLL